MNLVDEFKPHFMDFYEMNYLQYYPTDVINGEGTRCTLFVSGCTHACKGCYNQKSWSFSAGVLFDEAMEQQIINDLKDTRIKRQGLTLSGGDPLHPPQRRNIIAICATRKTRMSR